MYVCMYIFFFGEREGYIYIYIYLENPWRLKLLPAPGVIAFDLMSAGLRACRRDCISGGGNALLGFCSIFSLLESEL